MIYRLDDSTLQILKALADESRLRILGVLCREPLNVNELTELLEMGQSRVSRHLKILADAGILENHRSGPWIYYGFRKNPSERVSALLDALGFGTADESRGESLRSRQLKRDRENLARILELRKQESVEHFQRFGFEQERLQQGLVDARYYRRRIFELLPEQPGVTADLGCGAGELAALLRLGVEKFIGVDQSSNMLERAARVCPEGDFRLGALEHLPLREGEADTVILSMALHHLPEPGEALQEAFRVLKEGGFLLVADLSSHQEEIMRGRFADFWLGFDAGRLREQMIALGFRTEKPLYGKGEGELECLFLRGRRPISRKSSTGRRNRAASERERELAR